LGRNEEVSLVQYINSWQTSKKNLEYFFAEQFSFAAGTLFQQQKKIVSAKKNYSTFCDGLTASHTHDS